MGHKLPAPAYNFDPLPTVRSRDPLWEDPPDTPVVVGLSIENREVLVTTLHDAIPDHRYHMAKDSPWSVIAGVLVGATLAGVVFHPIAIPIGGVLLFVALVAWFWPAHEPKPIHYGKEYGPFGEPNNERLEYE